MTTENQVAGIQVKVNSMDTRLGRVEGMTTAIHGNVTRMMAVQESQGQDIAEMKGTLAEHGADIAFMKGQLTTVIDLLKRDRE